jgi:hypothetical protein
MDMCAVILGLLVPWHRPTDAKACTQRVKKRKRKNLKRRRDIPWKKRGVIRLTAGRDYDNISA